MLINSKLFNYSSLKPWHFKPINSVAEGKRPDVGGEYGVLISVCAALLLFKADHLLWYSKTPHTHLPLHMRYGAQATLFPSQMQIIQKSKGTFKYSQRKRFSAYIKYARTPLTQALTCGWSSAEYWTLLRFYCAFSRWIHTSLLLHTWADLPLSSVLAMRRAALSDWRLRFLSSNSTSRGLVESWPTDGTEVKRRHFSFGSDCCVDEDQAFTCTESDVPNSIDLRILEKEKEFNMNTLKDTGLAHTRTVLCVCRSPQLLLHLLIVSLLLQLLLQFLSITKWQNDMKLNKTTEAILESVCRVLYFRDWSLGNRTEEVNV